MRRTDESSPSAMRSWMSGIVRRSSTSGVSRTGRCSMGVADVVAGAQTASCAVTATSRTRSRARRWRRVPVTGVAGIGSLPFDGRAGATVNDGPRRVLRTGRSRRDRTAGAAAMRRRRRRPGSIAEMTAAPWNLVTLAPLSPAMANDALGELPLVVVAPDRDDHGGGPCGTGRRRGADLRLAGERHRADGRGRRRRAPPRLRPAAQRGRAGARHRCVRRRRRRPGQRRRVQRRGRRRVGPRCAVRRRPPPQLGRGRAARRAVAAGGRDRPGSHRDRRAPHRHRRLRPDRPRRRRPAARHGLPGVVLVAVAARRRPTSTGRRTATSTSSSPRATC